jgi:glyoxylase-like metal-dependent hydrolase (beta-lactamase superfamily II)
MSKPVIVLAILLGGALLVSVQGQQPTPAAPPASTGSLRQLIPGHYVWSSNNPNRAAYNSGVIVTDEGVVVLDALESEAIARAQREAIAGVTKQPIRALVSSSHHDQYSKGNLAYQDVWKIGHENFRIDFLASMERNKISAEEQKARLPNQTYRDRLTFYLGGKEIQVLYLGQAHTRGDSVIFVPQDRIAYPSEILFANQFPTSGEGESLGWLRALEAVEALQADIFVPAHGPIQPDPRETRQELRRFRQIFTDARDAVQKEIARGATEDQAAAAVLLPQYDKLPVMKGQREGLVRRMYRELSAKRP